MDNRQDDQRPTSAVRISDRMSGGHRVARPLQAGHDSPVEERTIADFFRVAAGEQEWKGAAELTLAKQYQSLVRLLEENLKGVKVYRVGRINIGVYVVERSEERNWLGVSTRVVET